MIVAADLEGTLTSGETWKAVGRYLAEHGRGRAYRGFFLTHLPGALLVKGRLLPRPWYRDRWMVDLARLFKPLAALESTSTTARPPAMLRLLSSRTLVGTVGRIRWPEGSQ
jgi:phosphoserine phosphatase